MLSNCGNCWKLSSALLATPLQAPPLRTCVFALACACLLVAWIHRHSNPLTSHRPLIQASSGTFLAVYQSRPRHVSLVQMSNLTVFVSTIDANTTHTIISLTCCTLTIGRTLGILWLADDMVSVLKRSSDCLYGVAMSSWYLHSVRLSLWVCVQVPSRQEW